MQVNDDLEMIITFHNQQLSNGMVEVKSHEGRRKFGKVRGEEEGRGRSQNTTRLML